MNDLLAGLMLWIATNSTYDTVDLPLPSVVPMTAKELTREAYLLGVRYLKARHANDPLPKRNFWAHIYSRC